MAGPRADYPPPMWDAVVVGLGGVGAFALRALASRGARVLGVERFEPGHARGSSHGGTRIFRHAYFEHADYVPLLRHATRRFGELQDATGVPLLEACGTLLIGRDACGVLAASEDAAARHGVEVARVDAGEITRRWPLFAVPEGWRGVFEPGGGFVRPEAAVRAALDDARRLGAEVRANARVAGIRDASWGAELELAGERVRAARAVVCAGAWTARLLRDLAPRLVVTRQVQAWIAPRDPALATPDRLPGWFVARDEGPPLYGVPADPRAAGVVAPKFALHGRDVPADPDAARAPVSDAERDELRAALRPWMPGLGDVLDASSCLYTTTATEHAIVDRAPGAEHVLVAAGLSGHGFKLTPAFGDALSDLALDGGTALPVGFLAAGPKA